MGSQLLLPILVTGMGRSGSTLAMSLIGSDHRCVFDQVYPLESRYLSRMAYFAAQWSGMTFQESTGGRPFNPPGLGTHPVLLRQGAEPAKLIDIPTGKDTLLALWQTFSASVTAAQPETKFYAEKVSDWVPSFLTSMMNTYALYLFRDPRDLFLSANSMNSQRGYLGFGRQAADADRDHALTLAYRYLHKYENYKVLKRSTALCSIIRYEDLACDPGRAFAHLTEMTGLRPATTIDRDSYPQHRTTTSVEESIERWKREPISEDVVDTFAMALFDVLKELGYESPPPRYPLAGWDLSFSSERAAEARILGIKNADSIGFGEHGLELKPTGDDLELVVEMPAAADFTIKEIWLCLSGTYGGACELFWSDSHGDFSSDNSLKKNYDAGQHLTTLRLQACGHEARTGKTSRLKVRIRQADRDSEPNQTLNVRRLKVIPDLGEGTKSAPAVTTSKSVTHFFKRLKSRF